MSESEHAPKEIAFNHYLTKDQVDSEFGVDCGRRSEIEAAGLSVIHRSGRQHLGQIIVFGDTISGDNLQEDRALVALLAAAPSTAADRDRLKAENAELVKLCRYVYRYLTATPVSYEPLHTREELIVLLCKALSSHQPTADNESEAE